MLRYSEACVSSGYPKLPNIRAGPHVVTGREKGLLQLLLPPDKATFIRPDLSHKAFHRFVSISEVCRHQLLVGRWQDIILLEDACYKQKHSGAGVVSFVGCCPSTYLCNTTQNMDFSNVRLHDSKVWCFYINLFKELPQKERKCKWLLWKCEKMREMG